VGRSLGKACLPITSCGEKRTKESSLEQGHVNSRKLGFLTQLLFTATWWLSSKHENMPTRQECTAQLLYCTRHRGKCIAVVLYSTYSHGKCINQYRPSRITYSCGTRCHGGCTILLWYTCHHGDCIAVVHAENEQPWYMQPWEMYSFDTYHDREYRATHAPMGNIAAEHAPPPWGMYVY
jgi:hypothetical protein